MSQQWVTAEPDGSSVKWLSAWEPSRGFVRADTLLLCVQLSRLHTEVWEAVCRCGSQLQRERRACDQGTFRLVQGAVGAQRRGTGKPEPPHFHTHTQTADRHTDRWREDKQEGKSTYRIMNKWQADKKSLKSASKGLRKGMILLGKTIILQITALKGY